MWWRPGARLAVMHVAWASASWSAWSGRQVRLLVSQCPVVIPTYTEPLCWPTLAAHRARGRAGRLRRPSSSRRCRRRHRGRRAGQLVPITYVRKATQVPPQARNTGWRRASGSIIAFTDDDTVPAAGGFGAARRGRAMIPRADAVGGRLVPLDGASRRLPCTGRSSSRHGTSTTHCARPLLVTANAAAREVLDALRRFD